MSLSELIVKMPFIIDLKHLSFSVFSAFSIDRQTFQRNSTASPRHSFQVSATLSILDSLSSRWRWRMQLSQSISATRRSWKILIRSFRKSWKWSTRFRYFTWCFWFALAWEFNFASCIQVWLASYSSRYQLYSPTGAQIWSQKFLSTRLWGSTKIIIRSIQKIWDFCSLVLSGGYQFDTRGCSLTS